MHPCFSLCDFPTRGAHGATCPAPTDRSVAPTIYLLCVRSSSVLIFPRVVSVYHDSKLLWWTAQECQFQICELMRSCERDALALRICRTVGVGMYCCARLIWQSQFQRCLPSQPVALLRCRQVVVDLKWSGTVVWFCVPSGFGRFLRLHNRKIGLLFQPGVCELASASTPFPGILALRRFIGPSQRVPRPSLT